MNSRNSETLARHTAVFVKVLHLLGTTLSVSTRNRCNQRQWDSANLHQGTSYQCRYRTNQYERMSINHSVSPNSDESGKQSMYPDSDPDCHQNLIICSMGHWQPALKILCKSIPKFFRKVANRQTDRQTNNDENITSLAEVKMASTTTSILQASGTSKVKYQVPHLCSCMPVSQHHIIKARFHDEMKLF